MINNVGDVRFLIQQSSAITKRVTGTDDFEGYFKVLEAYTLQLISDRPCIDHFRLNQAKRGIEKESPALDRFSALPASQWSEADKQEFKKTGDNIKYYTELLKKVLHLGNIEATAIQRLKILDEQGIQVAIQARVVAETTQKQAEEAEKKRQRNAARNKKKRGKNLHAGQKKENGDARGDPSDNGVGAASADDGTDLAPQVEEID